MPALLAPASRDSPAGSRPGISQRTGGRGVASRVSASMGSWLRVIHWWLFFEVFIASSFHFFLWFVCGLVQQGRRRPQRQQNRHTRRFMGGGGYLSLSNSFWPTQGDFGMGKLCGFWAGMKAAPPPIMHPPFAARRFPVHTESR